jgi:hypothetical protein
MDMMYLLLVVVLVSVSVLMARGIGRLPGGK